MDVHFDDAGIRRDVQHLDARIARRRVALDRDRRWPAPAAASIAASSDDVVLDARQRRHEHVQMAVAHLHAERRLDHFLRRDFASPARACALGRDRSRRLGKLAPRREGIDGVLGIDVGRQHRRAASRAAGAGRAANRPAARRGARAAAATDCSAIVTPRRALARTARSGKDESGRAVEPVLQQLRKPRALGRLREIGLQRVDIRRQRRFGAEELRDVFVRGDDVRGIEAKGVRERVANALRRPQRPLVPACACRRSARRRATAACRRCATTRRAPSAAAARPDTTCPVRNAGSRRTRTSRASRRSSVSASSRFFGDSAE